MLKISFYILSSTEERQRSFFCCKLVEKAYREGYFCYLLTDSDNQSRMLDSLLWTFRANSFIPHEMYLGQLPTVKNTILIGSLSPPNAWKKLIINFSRQPLDDLTKTQRLLEIVDNHPQRKQIGKSHYRHYQQQGLKMTIFHLSY